MNGFAKAYANTPSGGSSGALNQTQKVTNGATQIFTGANKQNQIVINPQNIVFARGNTNSYKDKRLTMFPEDIKQFVIDQNKEKVATKEMSKRLN